MAPLALRANILIAPARDTLWAEDLAKFLTPLPVDLHWSRNDRQALEQVMGGAIHVAVLDEELPPAGGLSLVRRFRRIGLGFPCLLVCREADDRTLCDALEVGVFSVLSAEAQPTLLRPMVLKAFRRVHPWDWAEGDLRN